jgi:hypothetical protein
MFCVICCEETAMHELDKTINNIEEIMRLAWGTLGVHERDTLMEVYVFALIRRIADKGRERS